MSKNITTLAKADFSWSDGKRMASLAAEYKMVIEKIDDAINWYQTKKIAQRTLARWLRVGAIVLGTIGTAMPTISEMALRQGGTLEWWLRPGVATLIGLAVAAMIMLDRFLGASSGWIRYSMAETTLKEMKEELVLSYALECSAWSGAAEPTVDQTKHAMAMLQSFIARGNEVVREETLQWKAEFQSALTLTEEFAKTTARKPDETTLTVKIANPDRLAGTWEISVNDSPFIPGASDTKTFELPTGSVTIRVKALVKTADGSGSYLYSTETGDFLTTGAAKVVTVTLPAK